MPLAGADRASRASAHFRWAQRYHEGGDAQRAAAHFGRAMEYGEGREAQTSFGGGNPMTLWLYDKAGEAGTVVERLKLDKPLPHTVSDDMCRPVLDGFAIKSPGKW